MCPPSAGATRRWEYASGTDSSSTATASATAPDCVPQDPVSQAAYAYAQVNLHPIILNHSLRVYLLAHGLGARETSPYVAGEKLHLLFTACILHGIGTTAAHDGDQRFEVEGGDAAFELLRSHNVSDAEAHDVWTAIAIHTSPGIAERIHPLSRLVRMGVAMDFKRPGALQLTSDEEVARVEALFPRGEIEKVLGDAVVGQVLGREREGQGGEENVKDVVGAKAPAASWSGILVRSARENPGWEGVNKAF